jgi:hypothetical protein
MGSRLKIPERLPSRRRFTDLSGRVFTAGHELSARIEIVNPGRTRCATGCEWRSWRLRPRADDLLRTPHREVFAMAGTPLSIEEIDDRIAIVRDNLRQLAEQAAAQSGAADDDRTSQRIAEHEAELTQLKQQREKLTRSK